MAKCLHQLIGPTNVKRTKGKKGKVKKEVTTFVKGQNGTQCKGICCVVVLYLDVRQLRFSLCSEAVMTKALVIVVFLYYSLSLAL